MANTGKQVSNLTRYDFMANEKVHAIETLWKYAVRKCGPPGFSGTIGLFLCTQFVLGLIDERLNLQMST